MFFLAIFTYVQAIQVQQVQIKQVQIKSVQTTIREIEIATQQDDSIHAYTKDEVRGLIELYARQYGIDSNTPLKIAYCESGYNWNSKNKYSTASGVFQYLASTWSHTELGKQGVSVFDADANVHMAIASIANGGIGNWNASKSCWNN